MKTLLAIGLIYYSQFVYANFLGEVVDSSSYNCGQNGELEIAEAMKYIRRDFRQISNSALQQSGRPQLNHQDIASMQTKLDQIEIECSTQNACAQSRVGGYHSTDRPNKIYICYHNIQNLERQRGAFCQMLGTVFHEMAHAAGIEIDPNHNHGPNTDKVYQLGNAATTYCLLNPHWYNEVVSKIPRKLAAIQSDQRQRNTKRVKKATQILAPQTSDAQTY